MPENDATRCGPGHAPRHAGRRLRRRPVRRSESGHGRVLRLHHVHGLGRVGPWRRAQPAGPQPPGAGHDRGAGPDGGVPPPRRRPRTAPGSPTTSWTSCSSRSRPTAERRPAMRPSARSSRSAPSRPGADDGVGRRRRPGQHGQRPGRQPGGLGPRGRDPRRGRRRAQPRRVRALPRRSTRWHGARPSSCAACPTGRRRSRWPGRWSPRRTAAPRTWWTRRPSGWPPPGRSTGSWRRPDSATSTPRSPAASPVPGPAHST